MPELQAVRDNLDAPLIGDGDIEVHVGKVDVACDLRSNLTADASYGVLTGQGAVWTGRQRWRTRHGGRCAGGSCSCPARAAGACARMRKHRSIVMRGAHVEGTAGRRPRLSEQQARGLGGSGGGGPAATIARLRANVKLSSSCNCV